MSDDKLQDLEIQFKMHETQCEERWKTIFTRVEGVETRLDKMHHLILGGGATTILFRCRVRRVEVVLQPVV